MEDGIFFNQSKYITEILKKFGLEDSKLTKTLMSTEIKLTKNGEADSVNSTKYQGTKMPSEYQQDFKKTPAYDPKIYNDLNMSKLLKDIYRALESSSHGFIFQNTSSYHVTHPTSVVNYNDEYQQDDIQTNSEDPLTSAMLLLARAITQKFSNPTNNHLRTSSDTRNQAVVQGDRVNIQSRNSSNAGRNNRRAYVQEEVVEGANETGNVQRTIWNSSLGNTSTVQ
nr:retrovirus-related Pol polyprotein from transposon TNT 1-94 [Tanacetum cinerariifolium]